MRESLKSQNIGTRGECALGVADTKFENMSLRGTPTLVRCPFSEWAQIITQKGCSKWKTKTC